MKNLKRYKEFKIAENVETAAEPAVKPDVKPDVKPGKPKPKRPSPIRRIRPNVKPAPKASEEDVVKKYLELK